MQKISIGASSPTDHEGEKQMRATREEIPVAFEEGGVVSRQEQWGEMHVAREIAPAGMDTRPLFKDLPEGACQCPHWGYMLRGKARVIYSDREEVLTAGDAYYLEPGHNLVVEEDGEIVEFSPAGEYQKTMEAVAENMQAAR
ncbi:MAG: cupin domain-containing protein [Rubrobacter sp.]|jgi:hypothetical protein|nr:cupin domain-containing protein [Rubrobacter sp.]